MKTTFVLLPIAFSILFSANTNVNLNDPRSTSEIPDSLVNPEINYLAGFNPTEANSSELFRPSNIWNIHLAFNDSSWEVMHPTGGFYGEDGEPGRWNMGNLMYPTILGHGDMDYNGEVSYEEFMKLSNVLYDTCRSKGTSDPGFDQLGAGLKELFIVTLHGPDKNGLAPLNGISTPSVFADLEFNNRTFGAVSTRYKGNGTLISAIESLKKPLKIDINDDFPGRKLAGVTKLNFHNLIDDPGCVNDVIAFRLYNDAGVPAPRTAYATVSVTVPDSLQREYLGLYLMTENVDKRFIKYRFDSKKGEVLKPVSSDLFEYHGEHWNKRYERIFDPKTNLSHLEEMYLIEICKFVQESNEEEFSEGVADYFDLDNLARYMAVTSFVSDLDGVLGAWVQNFYIYMDPESYKLSFMAWDQDHSMGNSWQNFSQEQIEQVSITKPWIGNSLFLERLFNQETFSKLYFRYMEEFSQTIFQPDRINEMITRIEKEIRPFIAEESEERLAYFDYTMGREIDKENLDSAKLANIVPVKTFVVNRHRSVVDQISGKTDGITFDPPDIPDQYLLSEIMIKLADVNKDSFVTKQEINHRFDSLYRAWGGSETVIPDEQVIRDGLDLVLK